MNERTIFISALDKDGHDARAAYLAEACGGDADLRQRVEHLLRAYDSVGSFLERPALGDGPLVSIDGHDTVTSPAAVETSGSRIGHYKLLEKIGEGGMGVVFMAEQEWPVRRRVALKIIKPGMDSAQVVARFEAERQALAMMDHINIARVYDAGTTTTGRPYFVMELVHGVPITKYCDDQNLPLRQRLELFVDVCHAVQHAHQKGIIHRDIKPSNVLITLYDGKPVPKVIDFGVAKAIDHRLTERTLFTRYGTLVGTLEYMAPEQAEMSALGVDTRSDVYSLGVLLYELLTGTTPIDRERIREAAFDDVLRLIREEEPQRPSTRISTTGGGRISGAGAPARGKSDPQKLTKLVRGELDWIVMKCLEKDRARRYETANGLAMDVRRHLDDEPVQATPPSRVYALRKFARRNKALLATTAVIAVALLAGTAIATRGMLVARRDRRAALEAKHQADQQRTLALANAELARKEAYKASEVNNFLKSMLTRVDPSRAKGSDPTVREALDEAVKKLDDGALSAHPGVEAALRHTIANAYMSLGLHNPAHPQLEAALRLQRETLGENHPDVAATLFTLGDLAHERMQYRQAADLYEQSLKIRRMAYGEENEYTAVTLTRLADAKTRQGDLETADKLHEQAVALARKVSGAVSINSAAALNNRAIILSSRKDYAGAEKLFREARDVYRKVRGDKDTSVARVTFNIGICRVLSGDDAAAEQLFRQSIADYRELYGKDHPAVVEPLINLQHVLERRKDPEADEIRTEIMRLQVIRRGHEIKALPHDAELVAQRADYLGRLGRFKEELADLELAKSLDPNNLQACFAAGIGRLYQGDVAGYRAHARELMEKFTDANHPEPHEHAAKLMALGPPDGADLSAARQRIDKAMAFPMPESRIGWFQLTKAMVEYRAGDHAECVAWLEKFWPNGEKINFGDPRYPTGAAHALAAMAHHRLGDAQKASDHFGTSARLLAECPQPGQRDLGPGPDNWLVWAMLHREAAALLQP